MKREEIAEAVLKVLSAHDLEPDSEQRHLVNDLGADSLDRLDIMVDLESDFQINVSDEEAAAIETVGNIIDLIGQKLEEDGR